MVLAGVVAASLAAVTTAVLTTPKQGVVVLADVPEVVREAELAIGKLGGRGVATDLLSPPCGPGYCEARVTLGDGQSCYGPVAIGPEAGKFGALEAKQDGRVCTVGGVADGASRLHAVVRLK